MTPRVRRKRVHMKIAGIIAEYNPFHNGHLYHLEETLKASGCDACVAVMSGDFVQRGAPAVMPKRLRAKAALECGVSVVIELPPRFSTSSAKNFAYGAVSLLDKLGCIDTLSFGSECADIGTLREAANIIKNEPAGYKKALRRNLKLGMSYPLARQKALSACLGESRTADLLKRPNNILSVEYLNALADFKSDIKPLIIPRTSSYDDPRVHGTQSSALALRCLLLKAREKTHPDPFSVFLSQVPEACLRLYKENYLKSYPVSEDDFSLILRYCLLRESSESLALYDDVSSALANRIKNLIGDFNSFSEFTKLVKTKNLNYTRVARSLTHVMLDLRKNPADISYARVLGFRKDALPALATIAKHSRIPLIMRASDQKEAPAKVTKLLQTDFFASDLYESVVSAKYGQPFHKEANHEMVFA